jgi:hypothetical protein
MEAIGICSENLLFAKLQSDYAMLYERFPNRRNFNKRRKKLQSRIDQIALDMADKFIKMTSSNGSKNAFNSIVEYYFLF